MPLFTNLQTAFPYLPWEKDVSLAPFTYMKVGGPAEVFWRATRLEDLRSVSSYLFQSQIPFQILGGASNVVIDDAGLSGVTIVNECTSAGLLSPQELPTHLAVGADSEKTCFYAHSGIKTSLLVSQTVERGLAGLESFLGVPGTLGGATYNNAHYTKELIGSFILGVEVVTPEGESKWLKQEECQFAYDSSRFQGSGEVILQVIFALLPGDKVRSLELIKEATVRRATTQPLGTANSGCMFKNAELSPEQRAEYDGKETLSAGWLIDQAGLKNTRVGGAVVSEKHANFIINDNHATAADVRALVRQIQDAVQQRFGIELKTEVFFLGNQKE